MVSCTAARYPDHRQKCTTFAAELPFLDPTPQFRGPIGAYDASRLRTRAITGLLWPRMAIPTQVAGFALLVVLVLAWSRAVTEVGRKNRSHLIALTALQDSRLGSHSMRATSPRITLTARLWPGEEPMRWHQSVTTFLLLVPDECSWQRSPSYAGGFSSPSWSPPKRKQFNLFRQECSLYSISDRGRLRNVERLASSDRFLIPRLQNFDLFRMSYVPV